MKTLLRAFAALSPMAALGLPTLAHAEITVGDAVLLATGSNPASVAIADFNADGRADLAVTVDTPDRVQIYFGTEFGFSAPVNYNLGSGVGADTVLAADVDGDGDQDLAIALHNANAVRVLVNTGSGAFSAGQTVSTGANPVQMIAAQLGGSSLLDFATANRDGNSASVLLNAGGTLGSVTVGGIAEPRGLAAGDFNGDGDLDLAVTSQQNRSVSILNNNGAGGFTLGGSFGVNRGERPEGVAAGDLDADGDADLAVTFDQNTLGFVGVMLNNGAGAFSAAGSFTTGGQAPGSIQLADLDRDGRLDAVVANEDSGTVAFLAGTGSGTFGAPMLKTSGNNPDSISIGDLDGDGDMDVAAPNRNSSNVALFYNLAPRNEVSFGPTAFQVLRGTLVSGDLASLQNSDDSKLTVRLSIVFDSQDPVRVQVDGVSPISDPTELRLSLESSANKPGIRQRVLMYNFQTASYELLSASQLSTADGTVVVAVTTNPGRFVEAGTGKVHAQLFYQAVVPQTGSGWNISADKVGWTVK
ncbi:MAG: VCBS repeat-containing protein [Fimbriimonadaceae bacterium]